ncbi:gp113 [Synechococcus phage syn9]|uniref:Gp113 n=1 Tax=Synechococcus phage syn9 TaxID=382359 RepID=Q0QZB5_BPSYS|nr:gp113 [Synechococcus phage syn9]ABA47081.1 gp113 [Synechococcus phage syn9]AGH56559.1 hypothetical protein CPUG_00067 [Cyanophage Syn10]
MSSNVTTPVQDLGSLTDNSDDPQTTAAYTVKTGLYRFINADSHSNHFAWGGAPNVATDMVVHMPVDGAEIFRLAKPKAAKIAGATAADPCVLTLDNPNQQTNIVVGDYVTISGAAVSGYNFSHKEVTAVNPVTGAITIDADASALAAFTGTAFARNSIKIQAKGDSTNGMTMYINEVQVSG